MDNKPLKKINRENNKKNSLCLWVDSNNTLNILMSIFFYPFKLLKMVFFILIKCFKN